MAPEANRRPGRAPESPGAVSRRALLRLAGLTPLAAAACGPLPWNRDGERFDHETDVAVVGSGAAGPTAALIASSNGARALLLEKAQLFGGTTAKSGGVYFVPASRFERERGLMEPRPATLRAMARASYPQLFAPDAPRFGVPQREYALLEALYDSAPRAVDDLEAMGALRSMPADVMVGPLPDYLDTRTQGTVVDRRLWPRKADGSFGLGDEMMRQLKAGLAAHGIPVLLGHRARRLLLNGKGEVVGLEAETGEGAVARIRARRGVVFATGGFTHSPELLLQHQPGPVFGGCAVPTNQGDFVYIAAAVGAKLGHMWSAWRAQVVLDQALQFSSTPDDVFMPPGDSMILVNRLGRRVVNEKTNYNDRTRVQLEWDPWGKEYVNALLFMVYDLRTAELFAGRFPLPPAGATAPYVVEGATLEALAAALEARLAAVAGRTGGARLAPDFVGALKREIDRFNGFAEAGVDADFHRGEQLYDREWHSKIWSFPNPGTRWTFDAPNPTMAPLAGSGPYFAIALASGTLDTNGGPVINAKAQVLDTADRPIPGLYGAGNCIASPSGPAYYGGGGTLGPALAFGWLAGRHAAAEPPKELV